MRRSTTPDAGEPPETCHSVALADLTQWLLRHRPPDPGDRQIRPRHWRWAACRMAMRHAVLGILAAKHHVPDPGHRWSDWGRAASQLGRRGAPLFQPAPADSPRPELRALAALEARRARLPDPDLPCPALPRTADLEPAALLGSLYQALQEVVPAGGVTAARAHRKRSGSFYTGSALARPTVERTLAPLIRGNDAGRILRLRICDPAMGAGPFLVEALNYLTDVFNGVDAESRRRLRRLLATSVLFGVDLDPTAVDLGRWAIWLEVDDPGLPLSALTARLRVGNSLLGCPADCRDPAAADRWVAEEFAESDSEQSRVFHWPLEFPEVFASGGFDAVIGNPPWETLQPSSKEFFCELDAEYGSLGKQQALRRQQECLEDDPGSARDWQRVRTDFQRFSKYAKRRFSLQGSNKLYTYRLFLEQSHELLREGGRLGMIVPSGLYTDLGSASLRRLLLERCSWEWLFCFENRNGMFEIDSRYRFGPIIVEKGGQTRSIKTAFLRTDPADWQRESPPAIPYSVEQVRRLSPRHGALLDVRTGPDLEILDKIQAHGKPFLVDAGGDLHFAQGDFNMTSDSALFRERQECEAEGYVSDLYGRWRRGDAVALPLYQGAMLYDLHPCAAVHAGGAGHRTTWLRTDPSSVRLGPQFLVDAEAYADLPAAARSPQLVLRALSNATNERTVVPGLINDLPCGNSLVILRPEQPDLLRTLFGAGVMSSLIYDWSMRQRMAGTNLNRFILSESVWPEVTQSLAQRIAVIAARLALITPRDAPIWLEIRRRGWLPKHMSWTRLIAMTHDERRRLHCMLDAMVAAAFGLDLPDLQWMLRDCDVPSTELCDRTFRRSLDPKGFWRIDRDVEPNARRTVLALGAFSNLREGDRAFFDQNGRDSWAPPTSPGGLRLPWQDSLSPDESWRLCAWHARQSEDRSRA